jgi:ATP-dependent Clp protease ATP-binding subunit ClpC
MKDKVMEEMKKTFRPEFLNRIDGTVVFHALNKDHIRQIVELDLQGVEKQLNLKGVSLEVTDEAKDWLGEKGFDQVFGARPLRRVIQNEIEDKLSEGLLQGDYEVGDTVSVDVEDGGLVFRGVKQPALA